MGRDRVSVKIVSSFSEKKEGNMAIGPNTMGCQLGFNVLSMLYETELFQEKITSYGSKQNKIPEKILSGKYMARNTDS